MIGTTQRRACAHTRNRLRYRDLAGVLDALELAYAKDCIAAALRYCEEENGRESAAQ